MNKEEEQAQRLAKLQSTLQSVQMPQADQNLVGYHRERRPLAEEELERASPSGRIATANEPNTENERLVLRKEDPPQLVKDPEEVGGQSELRETETKDPFSERVSGASNLNETLYDRLADQVEADRRKAHNGGGFRGCLFPGVSPRVFAGSGQDRYSNFFVTPASG